MPCGGIFPIKGSYVERYYDPKHKCWICNKPKCTHFCEEWDCGLHVDCAVKFLTTEEGILMREHGHLVQIDFGCKRSESY